MARIIAEKLRKEPASPRLRHSALSSCLETLADAAAWIGGLNNSLGCTTRGFRFFEAYWWHGQFVRGFARYQYRGKGIQADGLAALRSMEGGEGRA